ncbi:MAG TPA: hypothetical protein VF647_09885 [Longimicrobium sp.]|jgi:hypothetical protein
MTADEFRARYALLDQVAGGGVRTFHAVTPTAGVAMVHFVDGGITPYNLALLSALERLEPERRARVREVTAVDGSITVVTELLAGFRSLPAWLGLDEAEPAPASPAPATPDSAHATPDGPAGSAPPAQPAAIPSDPPAADPAESPVAGRDTDAAPALPGEVDAPRKEPGEFTRLFMAADLTGAPAFSGPVPPAGADSAPSLDAASLRAETDPAPAPPPASSAAPAPPVPPPAAPAAEPGDFTRLFRAPLASDAASRAAAPANPPAPAAEEAAPSPPAAPETGATAPRPADPAAGFAPAAESRSRTDELASFRAATIPPADPPRAPADPAAAAFPTPPPAGTGTGGATGVFSAPVPDSGPAGAAPADAGGRGEFSQLFQRLDLPAWALPAQDRPASPPPAPEPLRLEHAPEPLPQPDDDYVDRLLSPSPRLHDGPTAEPPADSASSLLMPAFSAPHIPAGPPHPSPAAPSAPAPMPPPAAPLPTGAPARSTTPLIVGLILVVVLALALVAFFALR